MANGHRAVQVLSTSMLPTDELATIVRTMKQTKLYMACTFLMHVVTNYHKKKMLSELNMHGQQTLQMLSYFMKSVTKKLRCIQN